MSVESGHGPVLRTYGMTRKTVVAPLAVAGIAMAILLVKAFFVSVRFGVGTAACVAVLGAVLVVAGALTKTVVRADTITVAVFGRGSRTVPWTQVVDVRPSPVGGHPGRTQGVLYVRTADGSVEPVVAPHVGSVALGAELAGAIAELNDLRRAAASDPLDVDPQEVEQVERRRFDRATAQLRHGKTTGLVIGLAIVAVVLLGALVAR